MSLLNKKFLGGVFLQDPKINWIKIGGVSLGNSDKFNYKTVKTEDIGGLLDESEKDGNIACIQYDWVTNQAYIKSGFDLNNDSHVNINITTFVIKTQDSKKIQDINYGLSFYNTSQTDTLAILELTSIFENSTKELQFSYIEDINDGRGYTFGFVGFCSGTGDGLVFLEEYNRLIGGDTETLTYINAMKKLHINGNYMNPSHEGLGGFVEYVNKNGGKKEWIQANLNIANKLYVIPSQNKAKELGLKLSLSKGQLYDSYLNHGEYGAIDIINRVGNVNGDEIGWLKRYLNERYNVLAGDRTWKNAVDRINVYKNILDKNPSMVLPISLKCYGSNYTLDTIVEDVKKDDIFDGLKLFQKNAILKVIDVFKLSNI